MIGSLAWPVRVGVSFEVGKETGAVLRGRLVELLDLLEWPKRPFTVMSTGVEKEIGKRRFCTRAGKWLE